MLLIPYVFRRKILTLWIRAKIHGKFAAVFLRQLFSYAFDKRENLSSQLVIATSAIVVIFIFWAYLAEFDQVISAEAKVYRFSRLQTIEHFEGGRVSKIYVSQGAK